MIVSQRSPLQRIVAGLVIAVVGFGIGRLLWGICRYALGF